MSLESRFLEAGFSVKKFDAYHRRINGEFDFWRNNRCNAFAWHDRITGERGFFLEKEAFAFIVERFKAPKSKVTRKSFVKTLIQTGWSEEEAAQSWLEHKRQQKQGA